MHPAPTQSEALYLRLARSDVALFRFLLEAWEGVALFTSLGTDGSNRETLLLRFAPGMRSEVLRFIDAAQTEMALELLPAAPQSTPTS
jgi:hypothetical protein